MTQQTEPAAIPAPAASFLPDPLPSKAVERMYAADLDAQGYVAHLTRLWATCPEALHLLSQTLGLAGHLGGLDFRQRQLLITAGASALGDSYCSLAGGGRLAAAATSETAAAVIGGATEALSASDAALVSWARRMARDPNATTQADVDELRAAGLRRRPGLRRHVVRRPEARLRDGQRHPGGCPRSRAGRPGAAGGAGRRELRAASDTVTGHPHGSATSDRGAAHSVRSVPARSPARRSRAGWAARAWPAPRRHGGRPSWERCRAARRSRRS